MIQILSKAEFDDNRRIIVVSDIHGYCDHLEGLLKKVKYTADDILVILGDMIERGHQSLATLRFVKQLTERGNVYPLMGNVDLWEGSLIEDPNVLNDEDYLEHQKRFFGYNGATMFTEMLDENGMTFPETPEEMAVCRKIFTERYADLLAFIRSLPVILDTPTMRFVHGGMPDVDPETLSNADPYSLTKNDLFLRQEYSFDKPLIVGHWPTLNYRDGGIDLSAMYVPEQNIYCIDGGMGVTRLMQLNALVFADKYDINPVFVYYDRFPTAVANEAQAGRPPSVAVHYPYNEMRIIERRRSTAVIRNMHSGRILLVPINMLHSDYDADNLSDEELEIFPGDELGVISETEAGYLVKKNGKVGWYRGSLLR